MPDKESERNEILKIGIGRYRSWRVSLALGLGWARDGGPLWAD